MSEKVKEIIEKIAYLQNTTFPREELQFLIDHQAESTPYLLDSISNHEQILQKCLDDGDYFLPLYAFFLLAQFRETKAYPLIYNIFSLDSEEVDNAFSEFLTEDLASVLASVCGGDTSLINKLIEDTKVNQYVRGAALDAWLSLHLANLKTRDEVIAYYKTVFELPCQEEDFFRASLNSNCMDLRATELMPEIEKSYAENKVELMVAGDLKELKKFWKKIEKKYGSFFEESKPQYHLINDTISEIEGWYCFNPSKENEDIDWGKLGELFGQAKDSDEEVAQEKILWESRRGETYIRPTPKVGKNEPCLCGSGRKYKKCCLNKMTND